jgi:hypothetical protein
LILAVGLVGLYYLSYGMKIKFKNIAFSLMLFISFSTFVFPSLPKHLEKNYNLNLSRINPLSGSESDRNLTDFSYGDIENDRIYLISSAFKTLLNRPFGLGYQDQHLVIGRITGVYLIPHNYFLSLLLNYGLFLGSIWNFIVFFVIYKGFKYMKRSRISPFSPFFYLQIMMVSVVIYYLTHSPKWLYFHIMFAIYCSFIFKISHPYFIQRVKNDEER